VSSMRAGAAKGLMSPEVIEAVEPAALLLLTALLGAGLW
jgi:hypothetical protein